MKSFFLVIAILVMTSLLGAQPAAAISVDHDSTYANAGGNSRFSDPDDQLGGNKPGNSASSDSGNEVIFGMFATNGQISAPGYSMQGCLAAVCQH